MLCADTKTLKNVKCTLNNLDRDDISLNFASTKRINHLGYRLVV